MVRPGCKSARARGATINIPGGYPGSGGAAPNKNLSPYIDPFGQMLMNGGVLDGHRVVDGAARRDTGR